MLFVSMNISKFNGKEQMWFKACLVRWLVHGWCGKPGCTALVSDRSWARASPVFFIRGDFFWYSFVWQTKEYKSSPDEIGILMAGYCINRHIMTHRTKQEKARQNTLKWFNLD